MSLRFSSQQKSPVICQMRSAPAASRILPPLRGIARLGGSLAQYRILRQFNYYFSSRPYFGFQIDEILGIRQTVSFF